MRTPKPPKNIPYNYPTGEGEIKTTWYAYSTYMEYYSTCLESEIPTACSICGMLLISKFKKEKIWYRDSDGAKMRTQTFQIQCPNYRWYRTEHTHMYRKEVETQVEKRSMLKLVEETARIQLKGGQSRKDVVDFILERCSNNLEAIELIDSLGLTKK